jgi:hypothetical protein
VGVWVSRHGCVRAGVHVCVCARVGGLGVKWVCGCAWLCVVVRVVVHACMCARAVTWNMHSRWNQQLVSYVKGVNCKHLPCVSEL